MKQEIVHIDYWLDFLFKIELHYIITECSIRVAHCKPTVFMECFYSNEVLVSSQSVLLCNYIYSCSERNLHQLPSACIATHVMTHVHTKIRIL